jgi:hypothetical protein
VPVWAKTPETPKNTAFRNDIAVKNVEKPVFLGGFSHNVPLPESMEQPWPPNCRSRS